MINMQKVGLVVVAATLVGFIYWLLLPDDSSLCEADPEVCPCLKLIPEDKTVGLKFNINDSGKLTGVDFGGSKGTSGSVTTEIAEKFVQCIERVRDGVEILNYSRLDTSPLGQVANQWSRAGGMKVTLRPREPSETGVLNNLQIGPTSGLRWQIIDSWCTSAMADCVECSDTVEGEDTVAVEIRLKNEAPVKKEFWSGDWPVNTPTRPDWELVVDQGNRYLYSCRP